MNDTNPNLLIRFHGIDGNMRTLVQNDSSLVNRTLVDLHPARIFTQYRIRVTDGDSPISIFPSLTTRVDLITDRLSVWDYPFLIGALRELEKTAFERRCHDPEPKERVDPQIDFPIFFDVEMLGGQHVFL